MGREEEGSAANGGCSAAGQGARVAWAPAVGGVRQGEGRERRGLREGCDLAVEKCGTGREIMEFAHRRR
jgi:hypothetical protein